MKKKIIIFLFIILLLPSIYASSYYFSQDGNDASTTGNITNPFKTITKVNTLSLNPGDSVLFKRGDTWRLTSDAYPAIISGDLTGYITYSAYGIGNKPLFLGSINMSNTGNWTDLGSNIWSNTIVSDVGSLIFNDEDIIGARTSSSNLVDNQGEWYYNESTNILTLYSTTNPGLFYTNIEVAVKSTSQEMMFKLDDKSYVALINLSLKYGGSSGINGERMINISIIDNDLSYIGGDWQSSTNTRYGNCIDIQLDATNILVKGNKVSQCYDGGIVIEQYISGGEAHIANIEVNHNILSYCHYPIEYFSSVSTSSADNINIHHNTIVHSGEEWSYNERPDGGYGQIRLSRTPIETSKFNFTDNIMYTEKDYVLVMGSWSNTNWKGDIYQNWNLYHNKTGSVMISWNGSTYLGLSDFKNDYPNQDINSLESDPLFTDPVNGDFRPQAGSPACSMSSTGGFVGALPCADAPDVSMSLDSITVTGDASNDSDTNWTLSFTASNYLFNTSWFETASKQVSVFDFSVNNSLIDLSNDINGSISGTVTWNASCSNNKPCYTFGGSADYINLGYDKFDEQNLTVCARFMATTLSATDMRIVASGSENTYDWLLSTTGTSKVLFASNVASHATASTETSAITTNVWYDACGTTNPEKVFLNGVKQSATTTDSWSQTTNTKIGSRGDARDFIGQIADVRIFNYTLSDEQILAYHNNDYTLRSSETSSGESWFGNVCINNDTSYVCDSTSFSINTPVTVSPFDFVVYSGFSFSVLNNLDLVVRV